MEMLALSQSSLLLSQTQLRFRSRFHTKVSCTTSTTVFTKSDFPSLSVTISRVRPGLAAGIVSDSKTPSVVIEESSAAAVGEERVNPQPDTTDGDGFGGGDGGNGGGGGGGGDNNNNNNDSNRNEGEGEPEGSDSKKKMGMSMSQKLTLGYAALVGLGGVMGYLKSGSQKSLLAGGLSASLLYYVYSELPLRPTFASSIGLGLSAALLVVMGSRFKKSGKIFPAGVVSLVSLVMTGGYLHGIMRGMH